jgi:hypothetical protein
VAELGVRQSAEVAQASWPDDRAWCVAAEIDLAWTYVGASVTLINDVLASRHSPHRLTTIFGNDYRSGSRPITR